MTQCESNSCFSCLVTLRTWVMGSVMSSFPNSVKGSPQIIQCWDPIYMISQPLHSIYCTTQIKFLKRWSSNVLRCLLHFTGKFWVMNLFSLLLHAGLQWRCTWRIIQVWTLWFLTRALGLNLWKVLHWWTNLKYVWAMNAPFA